MAAPAFQAAGAIVKGGAAVSPAWPTHQANDVALLFVETANQAATLSDAQGFVEITNSPQGTGTGGTSAATRLTVFWKRATGSAEAAPTVADSGDHQIAVIVTFRGCIETGNPWDVTAGSVAAAATTAFSIPTVTTTVDEVLVVLALTNNGPVDTTQVTAAPTNAALTGITKRVDSQPQLPAATATKLRFGPYSGNNALSLIKIGPGGDTGAPIFPIIGTNPHSMLADLEEAIAICDDNDITMFAVTPNSPGTFGANTADGFDFNAYKFQVDKLAALPYFKDAVQRGRVICFIGDEPQHSKWNNSAQQGTWSPFLLNECGRYHKQVFGNAGAGVMTVVRQDCHRLRVGWDGFPAVTYDGLDYGVLQHEGPEAQAHETFLDAWLADVADGNAINVGSVPALNLWGGGNHVDVDGVAACWDHANTGASSGVIAGAVQGGTSPYAKGQLVSCATWNATPTAGKRTLVCSPAWLRRIIDVMSARADAPWLPFWSWTIPSNGSDFTAFGPLQARADIIAACDYAILKGAARSSANALRTPKVYP